MKSEFVKKYSSKMSIEKFCKLVGISKSGYYDFMSRMPSSRSEGDTKLIPKSFIESRKTYGSRRVANDLKDLGLLCSKNKVLRLMKLKGLKSTHSKKFRIVTTNSKHTMTVAKNVLDRKFTCLLYTSPSPRDRTRSRMPSSA